MATSAGPWWSTSATGGDRARRSSCRRPTCCAPTSAAPGSASGCCTGLAPAGVDPLAPEAPLAFVFSPLVGTPLTTSAKFAVVAKSPLTGLLTDALASSQFAIAGKLTGHDAIVVRGRAAGPSVLLVDGDGVRLEPAAGAGRAVGRATPRRRCASGSGAAGRSPPSARRGSAASATRRFSHDGRHAGRGGLGAVLGAKNVKAVAGPAGHQGGAGRPGRGARRREGPAGAQLRPGHREVPRARHAGQPARVQRALARCPPATSPRPPSTAPRRSRPRSCTSCAAWRRNSCASCSIGCEHIYRPQGRRQPAHGVRERVRARAAVRRVRPGRRVRRQRPLRRAGHRHDLGRRHDRLGDGVRRARADRRAVAALRRRRRAAARARRDRRPARASASCSPRAPGAAAEQRRPAARSTSRRRSRAWSCPATSRARCTRWRWASRSTPAAPTTTAPAPTRPTSSGDLDRLDGGPAHVAAAVEHRGPGRGHGLDDPVQVPARRLRRARSPSGRALLRPGHRLGRRRRRAARARPGGSCWPSGRSTCARAATAADDRLPAPAARRRRWSWAPVARRRADRRTGCGRWSTATTPPAVWTQARPAGGRRTDGSAAAPWRRLADASPTDAVCNAMTDDRMTHSGARPAPCDRPTTSTDGR